MKFKRLSGLSCTVYAHNDQQLTWTLSYRYGSAFIITHSTAVYSLLGDTYSIHPNCDIVSHDKDIFLGETCSFVFGYTDYIYMYF